MKMICGKYIRVKNFKLFIDIIILFEKLESISTFFAY